MNDRAPRKQSITLGVVEWFKRPGTIYLLLVPTIIDRVLTAGYFHLEANPIVNALGLGPWLLFSVLLLAGGFWIWFELELWKYDIAVITVVVYSVFVLFLTAANVLMIVS